jgi:hypothetical protein
MPMEAAADALGITVHALRLRIVHGTLKSRMTPAGIPHVLVGLEPAVSVMGRTGMPGPRVDPRPRSILRGLTDHLRWIGHRQGFTWAALYLALALLLALQAHPRHSQAADSFPKGKTGSAFSGESKYYSQPQQPIRFHQNTTQEVSSLGEFKSITRYKRQNRTSGELKPPIVGTIDDPTSEVGESAPLAAPISLWESITGFSWNATRSHQPAHSYDEGALSISTVSVGSYPGSREVMLWDNLNVQPGQPSNIFDLGSPPGAVTRKTVAAVATAFHLDTPQLGSFLPTTSEDPGSPTVGGSPPPLEGSVSAAPEPSSAVLSSLASTAVLLRRRRLG